MRNLCTVLARLCPQIGKIRSVAASINLDLTHIALDGDSEHVWHLVLEEADKRQQVAAMIQFARQLYPTDQELGALQQILTLYEHGNPSRSSGITEAPAIQQPITYVVNTAGGTFVTGDVNTDGGAFIGRDNQSGAISGQESIPSPEIRALRTAYLQRLFHRVDTIFLSQATMEEQGNKRLSLEMLYTAHLTQSLTTDISPHAMQGTRTDDEQANSVRRLTALESINRHKELVLLGAPGSGKSTFLKFIALCMAGELLGHPRANLTLLTQSIPAESVTETDKLTDPAIQQWDHGALLPVYIPLREFVAVVESMASSEEPIEHLLDYMNYALAAAHLDNYAPHLLRELLGKGGLILLDGFDEVPERNGHRQQLLQMLNDFRSTYTNCRIVFSSRPYAYQEFARQLPAFVETTLAPFQSWQISQFIEHYFNYLVTTNSAISPQDLQMKTAIIKAEVENTPHLHELAATPLFLTLMMSLFAWRGGILLKNRAELYEKGIDLLLNEWEQPQAIQNLANQQQTLSVSVHEWLQAPRARVRSALEELAFYAHDRQTQPNGAARISTQELVVMLWRAAGPDARVGRLAEYLEHRAGLLIDQGDGTHSFPHRTIQEYLAACYLTYTEFPKKLIALVRADLQRWYEVFLLAGSIIGREKPYAIWALLRRLCPQPFQAEQQIAELSPNDWRIAHLAGQLVADTALYAQKSLDFVEMETLNAIKSWLVALVSSQQLSTQERALAGTNLGLLGDERPGVGLTGVGLNEESLPNIEWIALPAGPFVIGSEELTSDLITEPYSISRYPITIAQYQRFIDVGGYNEPRYWTAAGWAWRQSEQISGPASFATTHVAPNHPQTGISWYEAIAFCAWLSAKSARKVTLPSEVQWERAARHTDGRIYPWGNEFTMENCNMRDDGVAQTTAVGLFANGNAHCGAADMAGNVWEWCATQWNSDISQYNPTIDDALEGTTRRSLRGGSWANDRRFMRCANRHRNHPDHRGPNVGFRVISSGVGI